MNEELLGAPTFKPLYEQIKELVLQRLMSGEWSPGDSIPSEMELASFYKVSQGTVRKAVDALASESLLIRKQGKGTFVATHNEDQIKLRFLRLMHMNGVRNPLSSQLLKCTRRAAPRNIATLLMLEAGSTIIEIKRLLSFAGRPVIYDHVMLPAQSFKGLNAEKITEYGGSLYRMYETVYEVSMVRASEKLTAQRADSEAAGYLNVLEGYPLLRIERLAYTYGDKAMEWRVGLCVTDEYYYTNELE